MPPRSRRRQPPGLAESGSAVPTLADVASSAAASIGLTGFLDRIGLGESQHAVVLLIDGLGWEQLSQHAGHGPSLLGGQAHHMTTVFPSTTPTALASLGTGRLPGAHGLVGAMFWVPEFEQVLAPLKWGDDPHPLAVQPDSTVFERAEQQGARVTTIGPNAYRSSGLTQAVLRGGTYQAAEDIAGRVREVMASTSGTDPSLTYVYWAEVDRVGHEHGVGSPRWCEAVERADALVAALVDALPPHGVMVVTADHGMVNCPKRIEMDGDPALAAGVRCLAGEPRARQAYVEPGQVEQVAQRWRERLGGLATVLTRDEVIDSGLMGPADDWVRDRIGDVVAIALDEVALVSNVDPLASRLLGQHGGASEAEMRIPCLVFRN